MLTPSSYSSTRILEALSSLNYRTGSLDEFLHEVACGICKLLGQDWAVVTLCYSAREKILASSLDIGAAADEIYTLHGTLTGTVSSSSTPLVVEDATVSREYGQAPDGYRAYLGVPLISPAGETIGTICTFNSRVRQFTVEDIRLAELFAERAASAIDNFQLYQQQQEVVTGLERLAEIGELAATIVHDLRNPLTTVLMGLKSFQSMELPERAQHRLELALDEAERLQRLVNEILQYTKQQALHASEIDLHCFLREMLERLQSMPAAQNRTIELEPGSTPIRAIADRDKLTQVVVNLVTNACEAIGDRQTVSISLGTVGDNAQVSVFNGGPPIPDDVLPKLGTPFHTTKSSGNGLGLAIVKRIVDAHGGRVSIASSATIGGTRIGFTLPLASSLPQT